MAILSCFHGVSLHCLSLAGLICNTVSLYMHIHGTLITNEHTSYSTRTYITESIIIFFVVGKKVLRFSLTLHLLQFLQC